jgi:Leucine-rich repeat (LRR) protein
MCWHDHLLSILVFGILATVNTSSYNYSTIGAQYSALKSLYDATNGLYWAWKNQSIYGSIWTFSSPYPDPCVDNWQGVNCICLQQTQKCYLVSLRLPSYQLVGELPSSIGNLSTLQVLDLSSNELDSTAPSTIAQMASLRTLSLANNKLAGSLPSDWSELSNLTELYLAENNFNGNLSLLSHWSSLETVLLRGNNFSGPLYSSWSNLYNMQLLDLADNRLSGYFPSDLSNWLANLPKFMMLDVGGNNLKGEVSGLLASATQLVHLNISKNNLEGSLPYSNNWRKLQFFSASSNKFEGTIPSCILNWTSIEYFNVANNKLKGYLPNFQSISNLQLLSLSGNNFKGDITNALSSNLIDLWLDRNNFDSTIPTDIALRTPNLSTLFLQDNQLSGSLPASIGKLSQLSVLFLYKNNLTGSIDALYQPSAQRYMQHIDINGNRFSGSLSPQIFNSKSLLTFVASTNCFSGSIPHEICNATKLQSLLLDGLSTSSACLEEIFPNSPYFHTFKVKPNNVEGKIPECVFDLPALQTLHLAGNTFSGNLPTSAVLAPSLLNFSIAHNALVNDIPIAFQGREWLNYDISYNRFRGYLSNEIPPPSDNASYRAEVNRLSGSIPSALLHTLNISILNGNNFACGVFREGLPINDPKFSNYDCGSDPVYRSFIFWGLLIAGAIFLYVVFVVATRWYDIGHTPSAFHHTLAKLDNWFVQLELPAGMDTGGLQSAKNLFRTIKRLFLTITAISVILLMPMNAGLTMAYSTQDMSYVWVTSSIFLSGWVPAFTMIIGFSIVLITVWLFLSLRRDEVERTMLESERNTGFYIIFTLVNIMVMGTADVAYVVGMSTYGGPTALSVILAISIFKLGWNEGFLMGMFLSLKSYFYFYICNDTYNLQRRDQEEYVKKLKLQHAGSSNSLPNEPSKRFSTMDSLHHRGSDASVRDSQAQSMWSVGSMSLNLSTVDRPSSLMISEQSPFAFPKDNRYISNPISMMPPSSPEEPKSDSSTSSSPRSAHSSPAIRHRKKVIQDIEGGTVSGSPPIHSPIHTSTISTMHSHASSISDGIEHRTRSSSSSSNQPNCPDRMSNSVQPRATDLADSLATVYTVKEDFVNDLRLKQRSYNLKTNVILNSHDIAVMTFNLIVNTVLLPGISVMFASPNCFYHIFYPSETIPGSYSFSYCPSYDAHAWYQQFLTLSRTTLPDECPNLLSGKNSVPYTASFTYNYTCASNIITVYAEAFIYQTIAISLIAPISKYVFKVVNSYLATSGDALCCFYNDENRFRFKEFFCCCYWGCFALFKSTIQNMLPRNQWTLQKEPPHDEFVMFDQTFIPRIYSLFSILLVYGVIFPPLAVAVCVAALVVTYSEEVVISRLITKAKQAKLSWVILRLSEECQGLEHRFTHPTLIWLMMLSVCPVYTYLVFDTASDPYGWRIGLIPAVFMFIVPTIFYIIRQGRKYLSKPTSKITENIWSVTSNTLSINRVSAMIGVTPQGGLERLSSRHQSVEPNGTHQVEMQSLSNTR